MNIIKKWWNTQLMNTFMYGCISIKNIRSKCYSLYTTNKFVKFIVNKGYYIYCYLICKHFEPEEKTWISKSGLLLNKSSITERYTYVENYKLNFDELYYPLLNSSISLYQFIVCNFRLFNIEDNIVKNSLIFIMKLLDNNNETCYFISRSDNPVLNFSFQKSDAHFLYIEYTHPEMTKSIELTLYKSWYYSGNELFTKTFVLRLLKYQSRLFYFDDNYKIKIIDRNINTVEIDSTQYILLTEHGYVIMNEDKITDYSVEDSTMYDYSLEDPEKLNNNIN